MAMLPMTSPREILQFTQLFTDEHWAKYRVETLGASGEVYLQLGGAWNPYDPRLIQKAKRRFLGDHAGLKVPLEGLTCTPTDWSPSVHAAMDRRRSTEEEQL